MFAILFSAFNVALAFVFRSIVVKFVIMFAAWFLAVELIGALVAYVPSTSAIVAAMGQFPPLLWYLLDLIRIDIGIPLMLSAMSTKFLIRRLPFVG
ncbi:DUF2523 domain-containing protein [Thiobacillus sp.]|uniref:DUF2523 domain-containing protein n=1 Tax=Thiobacillus sp. TaxID=924 RepID=UPI0025F33C34|nr:DUF2523 domain-containing protein [Thiobacillus sp.]MBT9540265.1 DUF2523 domain-containing protein [Thiobacillus sp.]